MSMKRLRKLLCVLLCLCLLPAACSALAEPAEKKVTVMIYMCGSNLESGNAAGTNCISEILASRFNAEEVNVVVLIGGSTFWATGYPTDELTLLEITGRRPRTAGSFELASMGDGATLEMFLNYCAENYPAEKYDLVVWDHGGGPIYGVCQDSLFHDTMDMLEMSDALKASPFADKGLDLILFHACLMGSAEVANVLSPFARYMVATEDSQYGLKYSWLSGIENDQDPLDTAKRVVDLTFEFNKEVIERQNASEINAVAVIDLAKAGSIVSAMDSFFPYVSADLTDTTFTTMSNQRRDATAFGLGDSGNVSSFDLVDLGDMVSRLSEENEEGASAVLAAIDDAVVYARADRDACCGLTVYHPFLNKKEMVNRMGLYPGLEFSKAYTDYLQSFSAILSGTPLAEWIDLVTSVPAANKDLRTLFDLTLTEDQEAHFGEASLAVLLKDEEGGYRFTFLNDDARLNEQGQLTGEFSGTALYALDGEGGALTGELEYELADNGSYLLPACLTDADGNEYRALVVCARDGGGKQLTPGSVQIWEEELSGYTGIRGTTLADYASVALTAHTRRETRNEAGTLLAFRDWEEEKTETWELPLDGSWTFCLVNDTLPTTELYATFQVTDSQNNTYSSEPLAVKGKDPGAAEIRITYDDLGLVLIDSLSVALREDALTLSGSLENITDSEVIILLEDLTVNGEAFDATAEVIGNGDDFGLLKGEQQPLYLSVPLELPEGTDAITDITFSLTLLDAANGEQPIGSVPVTISLNLPL